MERYELHLTIPGFKLVEIPEPVLFMKPVSQFEDIDLPYCAVESNICKLFNRFYIIKCQTQVRLIIITPRV